MEAGAGQHVTRLSNAFRMLCDIFAGNAFIIPLPLRLHLPMSLPFLSHCPFLLVVYPFLTPAHLHLQSKSERERAGKSANQPQLALTDATNAKLFPLCVCLYVQCFVSMLVCKCVCVCLCVYVCVALTLFVLQADRCSLRQH